MPSPRSCKTKALEGRVAKPRRWEDLLKVADALRLTDALNVEKTMAAPVTAIVAADTRFFERFDRTFPDRADMFNNMFGSMGPEAQRATAWDNGILQMAYLIIAVRAVGLDAGPIAGFDRAVVDEVFFPDGRFKTIYLVNIGYGDDTNLFPRLPRFNVDEIAQFS